MEICRKDEWKKRRSTEQKAKSFKKTWMNKEGEMLRIAMERKACCHVDMMQH